MTRTKVSNHQSSRLPALKRRRVNADLHAEYRFHDGGALYIPQPPLPPADEVSSSSMPFLPPPDSVPPVASMPLPDPIPSKHQDATVEKRNVSEEESHRSSKDKREMESSTSSKYDSDDASEKPSAPSSEAASDEDESSVDSSSESDYSSDGSEPRHIALEARKTSKRKYSEVDSQRQKYSDGTTRSTTTSAKRTKKGRSRLPERNRWVQFLEKLKQFKAKHGHCRVPKSSKELHQWLTHQRARNLNPNHSRSLKDSSERNWRTEELESVLGTNLGDWRGLKSTKEAILWGGRLEELKKFKANHGHCRVPSSSKELYKWLHVQCTRMLNPNHSRSLKDSSEVEWRTEELESVLGTNLGDWSVPKITKEANIWDGRLKELKKFKAKHGHCRVPTSYGELYNWLAKQRTIFLNPSHSRHLRDVSERERRTKELESVLGTNLGDWRGPKSTNQAIIWDANLDELKKFKAKHGHCRVPTSYGELYKWLYYQRTEVLNPKHSKFLKDTPERARRTKELESVLGINLGDWRKELESVLCRGLTFGTAVRTRPIQTRSRSKKARP